MASTGFGAQLFYLTPPNTWTEISGIVSITPPSAETATVDVSSLASPSGWKQFIAGMTDPGELSLEVLYTKEIFDLLEGFRGQAKSYRVEFPDELKAEFSGLLTKLETELKNDEAAVITVAVKVSGVITYTLPS